ncbi:MAG: glycosyltransferase family 61 protein [Alphaproteobacteria bacterium]|nr:glycosyltransferase family 61 protein [Alphaproteobacteria bacterium]
MMRIIYSFKKYKNIAISYILFELIYFFDLLDVTSKLFDRINSNKLKFDFVRYKIFKKIDVKETVLVLDRVVYVVSANRKIDILPLQSQGVVGFQVNSVYKDFDQKNIKIEARITSESLVVGHDAHPKGSFQERSSMDLHGYTVEHVRIIGNLQVVKGNELLVFDSHHDPENQAIGSQFVPVSIDNFKTVLCKVSDKKTTHLCDGILLTSKASANFFHFIYEDLSRFMQLEEMLKNDKLPVYVVNDMPVQHYQALRGLIDFNRVILIDRNTPYAMDKLYGAQIPVNLSEDIQLKGEARFSLCPEHILYMRNKLLEANQERDLIEKKFPKRIYLKRKSRHVTNHYELAQLLKKYDIVPTDTAKLSFKEQVNLFTNADLILGAAGAGLSNIIFCKPETQIIVLNSDRHHDNCVFSTLAYISKLRYNMVLGPPLYKQDCMMDFVVGPMFSYMSPFSINIKELEKLLKVS